MILNQILVWVGATTLTIISISLLTLLTVYLKKRIKEHKENSPYINVFRINRSLQRLSETGRKVIAKSRDGVCIELTEDMWIDYEKE